MNVFLDTSVVIAACASASGASRAIFDSAANNHWTLLASSYVVSEIDANLERLPGEGAGYWDVLRSVAEIVSSRIARKPTIGSDSKSIARW